jgi:hypothetical protein
MTIEQSSSEVNKDILQANFSTSLNEKYATVRLFDNPLFEYPALHKWIGGPVFIST